MKKDISNRDDIEVLVRAFYEKVKVDPVIGGIFNDVIKTKWEAHLPIMYNFWENILFYTGSYEGNPMEVHHHVNRLFPLTKEHFRKWNELFLSTVDELFSGTKADLAKQRALSISTIMQIKILNAEA